MMEPTAVASASSIDTIVRIVELLLIPILLRFNQRQEEQGRKINTIETVLIGAEGKNGIRSRVATLEKENKNLSLMLARHLGLEARREEEEED
jgi:hypothetical protein